MLAALRPLGGDVHAWEGDLADPALIPELLDQAERRLGPVEVLVNNAAYWESDSFVPRGAELPNQLSNCGRSGPER